MADLEWPGRPEPASLRRAARHALRRLHPELRVIAEDFLATTTPIDLLAVGSSRELVCVRMTASEAPDEDAMLLARSLSDQSWLAPRVQDLASLAPELGLDPAAEPRSLLLSPGFGADVRAALQRLPSGSVQLMRYRCLQRQGQLTLLLEPDKPEPPMRAAGRSRKTAPSDASRRLTDPPSPSAFRTGLTEADLGRAPHGSGRRATVES